MQWFHSGWTVCWNAVAKNKPTGSNVKLSVYQSEQVGTELQPESYLLHITVEHLFYDHPQNHIGVVVKEGCSSTRSLTIL